MTAHRRVRSTANEPGSRVRFGVEAVHGLGKSRDLGIRRLFDSQLLNLWELCQVIGLLSINFLTSNWRWCLLGGMALKISDSTIVLSAGYCYQDLVTKYRLKLSNTLFSQAECLLLLFQTRIRPSINFRLRLKLLTLFKNIHILILSHCTISSLASVVLINSKSWILYLYW